MSLSLLNIQNKIKSFPLLFYLSDSYFLIVVWGRTIAETVFVLPPVDGLIFPETNALMPLDGAFFLGDGWISLVPTDVVCRIGLLSLLSVYELSSSEAKFVDGRFWSYFGFDCTVVTADKGVFVAIVCCRRSDSSLNVTNLLPDERAGVIPESLLFIRSFATLSNVRLSSARICSKFGKS